MPRMLTGAVLLLALSSSVVWSQTMVEPVEPAPKAGSAAASDAKIPFGTATAVPDTTAAPASPINRAMIRIGPGDLLDVSIYGVNDYHQETRVNEAGELDLPLIGSVRIGGATIQEAQDMIAQGLVAGGYFRDPHVMVLIKDYASEGVSMLGEITKPGVYPIVGTKRLFDLVSEAGGFTAKAGNEITITHRDHPDDPHTVKLTEEPGKSMQGNVQIYPGDTIVVAKAGIVYVVGDVGRPGGFVMENNQPMTVLQAIAMAAGTNRTAALNSARIVRRTPTGLTEVKIPLKQIMAAKTSDMPMVADDILFVPGSAARNVMTRSMESVFQIATSAAIYGAHF